MVSMTPFEEFSSAYYLGRLFVEPASIEQPALEESLHREMNEAIYFDGTGVEATDRPLIIKMGNRHFPTTGTDTIPSDTLAVPREWVDDNDSKNPPYLREVLLAKAAWASQLLRLSNWRPNPDFGT